MDLHRRQPPEAHGAVLLADPEVEREPGEFHGARGERADAFERFIAKLNAATPHYPALDEAQRAQVAELPPDRLHAEAQPGWGP